MLYSSTQSRVHYSNKHLYIKQTHKPLWIYAKQVLRSIKSFSRPKLIDEVTRQNYFIEINVIAQPWLKTEVVKIYTFYRPKQIYFLKVYFKLFQLEMFWNFRRLCLKIICKQTSQQTFLKFFCVYTVPNLCTSETTHSASIVLSFSFRLHYRVKQLD